MNPPIVTTTSTKDSGQILRHQFGISVAELQKFLLAKRPQRRRARRKRLFSQARAKTPDFEIRTYLF